MIGKPAQLTTEEILRIFKPVEGQTTFYYGRIRNGKTYAATADILDLLDRGEVVYANWPLDLTDYDERTSFGIVLLKTIFGKKLFFKYNSRENFHYFSPELDPKDQIALLGNLVGVHIFIDEGQWVFNSHIKNHDDETRKLILHNGHYCRSLNIISQRPSNVMKDMRSQINIWYKCEKKFQIGNIILFTRSTIEDMKEDIPDEEAVTKVKVYWAMPRVYEAYNTHAMRGSDAVQPETHFEAYNVGFFGKMGLLMGFFIPAFLKRGASRLKPRTRGEKAIDKAFEETYPGTKPLRITDVKRL